MAEPMNNLLGMYLQGATPHQRYRSGKEALVNSFAPNAGPSQETANTYRSWLEGALRQRDERNDFIDRYGFEPPPNDETVQHPRRQDEAGPAPNAIWPPHSWWDESGVMPSTQKRYGQAQAFAAGALDLWGIPSAVLSRLSPSADQTIREVRDSHSGANVAGGLATLKPSVAPIRAIGDALAARGSRNVTSAAADAVSAAGLGAAGDVIRHGEIGPKGAIAATTAAPAAMMNRIFMPNLPTEMWKRAVIGGGAGALSGMPALPIDDNLDRPVAGAAMGAAMAAAGRPNSALANYSTFRDDARHSAVRDRMRDINLGLAGAVGAVKLGYALSPLGQTEMDLSTVQPNTIDFMITKDAPLGRPGRPYFPHEYQYMNPAYPPPQPSFQEPVNNLLRQYTGQP